MSPVDTRWKSKVDALIRLSKDQVGKPMVADYRTRIAAHENKPKLLDVTIVGIEAIVDG